MKVSTIILMRLGVVLDKFGKDIIIVPADDTHFTIHVNVAVSDQFL